MLINSQKSLFDEGGNVNIKGKIKGKLSIKILIDIYSIWMNNL
jgi:hypothetical protein